MSETFSFDPTMAPGATQREQAPTGSLHPHQLPPLQIGHRTDTEGALVRVRTLGQGGMGVVSLVTDSVLGREVAIKELKALEKSGVAGLLHEARMMGSLEHPNIIPVHALGQVDGSPVLVMKRVDGATWEALLRDPTHAAWAPWLGDVDPLGRHIEILEEVCAALAYAHSRGIVHRDVKPENVMLGAQGEIYLLDFGVAARAGAEALRPAGTPAFMAPEMMKRATVQPSMDVFLIGATLTQLLTGEPRYDGKTLPEVLIQVEQCAPTSFAATVDPVLATLANEACAADPDHRPSGAREIGRRLREWRRNRVTRGLREAARVQVERFLLLDESATRLEAHHAFSAAQFGLRHVLGRSPADAPATELLATLLSQAVRSAAHRQVDLDIAASWLAELEDLGRATEALRSQLKAAVEAVERQRQAELEVDVTVGDVRRAWFAVVVSVVGLATLVALASAGLVISTAGEALAIAAAFAVLFAVPGIYSALRLDHTRATRVFLTACGIAVVAVTANRMGAWRFSIPMQWMFAVDLLSFSVVGTAVGAFFRGPTLWFGAIGAVGFLAVVLAPASWAVWIFGTVVAVSPLVFTGPLFYRSDRSS